MAKFEVYKDVSEKFRFRLKAGNGEKILSSEAYNQKSSALTGIDSVKANAPYDNRYSRLTAKNGQHYFNLRAGNNEVIGTSEMYNTSASRDEGIEDVKRLAPDAAVVDLT